MSNSVREPRTHPNESHFIIVGAGAAGCAAAKSFTIAGLASHVVVYEQHTEPGGCAGYFSRGFPKRTFDAGATQLIECQPGRLQSTLYESSPAKNQTPAEELFELIPNVTQHWHGTAYKINLDSRGCATWAGKTPPSQHEQRELQRLATFLKYSATEAAWMWNLLSQIPRFPIQNLSDVWRAWGVFLHIPFKKKIILPLLFFLNCEQMMRIFGIRPGTLAFDVIRGLLIDTTQSTPKKSPWLAASMGISIVQRGIFRCRKGMRSYFRPLISSFEEAGGQYFSQIKLKRIETTSSGFRLTLHNQKTNQDIQTETNQSVLLNLTLWDLAHEFFLDTDPIRKTKTFKRWQKTSHKNEAWGAFAIYALIKDQPHWPNEPHYHQIFPSNSEPQTLQSSLYVSIPSRHDPAQPPGFRILTATIHVSAQELSAEQRAEISNHLVARIEQNLESELSHIETATPDTFARYTGRSKGRVGGFPLHFRNFLFFSNPSVIEHPKVKNCRLIVIGDTVFPGQGVIACSVSGIIGFERATRSPFPKLL